MPSQITAPAILFDFKHRFFGSIVDTPVQTALFGFGTGVLAQLAVEATIWKGLTGKAGYYFSEREITIQTGYRHAFNRITAGSVQAGWYNYGANKRRSSYFVLGAFSMPLLADRITPLVNLIWDGEMSRAGIGAAVTVAVTEPVDITVDYIPLVTGDNTEYMHVSVYGGGVIYKTYRHQFYLFVGNANAVTLPRVSRGARDYKPRIGFAITRLFDF
ncbi:MAG: hypothetical protein JW863_08275 [Chitinispirillaceae bacterium]|nr:hypothetical protein [Chitinispirillaceae bacterium]